MKKNLFLILLATISVIGYSQKKEINTAGKQIKQGSFAEAKTTLLSVESLIGSADTGMQAEYYLLKGQAYAGLGGLQENLIASANAFKKVLEIENASGNNKFSKQADEEIFNLRVKLVNTAIEDQNAERYQAAADKLYASYTISPKDTSDLYFAANNALNAQNYKMAAEYYQTLLDLGYVGSTLQYVAVHKTNGEELVTTDKLERDLLIKSGEYIKPSERVTASRRADIIRSLGIIYVDQDKLDEATSLIAEARKENPEDISLINAEAQIALKMKDMVKYNRLMQKIVESDPENPELFFNLGVSSSSVGDIAKAEEYYKKSLEINPEYYNSILNLAVLLAVDKTKPLVEEMNSLGTSAADNKRYDALLLERNKAYEASVPYFEKAIAIKPGETELIRTLMNIQSVLGNDEEANKLKAKLGE